MTLTQAAAILNVTEGTVRAYARPRAKEKDTPPVFYLWSARVSKSGSDLTYSDLPWNAHRSAHMSLSARGTYLPHCVALGFVDGLAIAVI
jgi:hypothetical protein